MNKCKVANGRTCILPEDHHGLHLTDQAGVTDDGRLYIVGFRKNTYCPPLIRHYVESVRK